MLSLAATRLPREYFLTRLKACNYCMQELQRVACNNCTWNHGIKAKLHLFDLYNKLTTRGRILWNVTDLLCNFSTCSWLTPYVSCSIYNFVTVICFAIRCSTSSKHIAIQHSTRCASKYTMVNYNVTRMWANAQPDGRPAEHRWRPLFNAAKFGWRPLLDAVQ